MVRLLLIFLLLTPTLSSADPIKVGMRMVDPFVSYTGDKGFDGYAYKLLLLMFPDEEFEFIRMDNIEDAIEKTKNGEVAFTIGAFSKTAEREEYLDFSHSFYQSKPAVAVRKRNTWVDNALWIAQRLGGGILIFIAMLYVVGFLVNKGDGDSKIKTTHQGAWWALVTFSTVGYGDLVPDTAKGKFLASIWIIASLFLIATFTGYMSSAMTVKKLTEQPTNLNYLATSKLATVEGSTSENLLTALNFNYQPFGYVEDALLELINGRVNAIIYDKPMLEYHLRGNENYDVWEIPSAPNEHYAFIFPEGSEMLETVNREMLRVLPSVEWQRIHNSYFK